jgi:hypothetical protein
MQEFAAAMPRPTQRPGLKKGSQTAADWQFGVDSCVCNKGAIGPNRSTCALQEVGSYRG